MQIYKWIPLKAEEQPADLDRNLPIIEPISGNNHQSSPATLLNDSNNNNNNNNESNATKDTSEIQSPFLQPLSHENNSVSIPDSSATTRAPDHPITENNTKNIGQNNVKMEIRKHSREETEENDANHSLELPPSKRIRFNDDNKSFINLNSSTTDDAMMIENDSEIRQYDELQQVNRNSLPFAASNISSNGVDGLLSLNIPVASGNHTQMLAGEVPSNITSVSQTIRTSGDESINMSLMDVSSTNLDNSFADQVKDNDEYSNAARMITNQLVDFVASMNPDGMSQ